MNIMMICGSRSPTGQTARAADAVLKGSADVGATVSRVFLPTLTIERCRQCQDDGWGLCRKEGRCVITDDFGALVDKLRKADAVVMATPVYYSDLSESLRAFTDRLRRTCTQEPGRAGIQGKPVIGVCVAGGGGGGAPACCVSLERVLTTISFDVVDMIPARRQNLQTKLQRLESAGQWLVTLISGT